MDTPVISGKGSNGGVRNSNGSSGGKSFTKSVKGETVSGENSRKNIYLDGTGGNVKSKVEIIEADREEIGMLKNLPQMPMVNNSVDFYERKIQLHKPKVLATSECVKVNNSQESSPEGH